MRLNLTQAKTREYVTQLMAEDGKKRQVRLTRAGLLSRVRKLREGLSGATMLRHAAQLRMSDKQRAEVVKELSALRELLDAVSQAVAGR